MAGPGGPSGPAVFAGSPDASLSWFPHEDREADEPDKDAEGGADT
jgi:hypothetical protein